MAIKLSLKFHDKPWALPNFQSLIALQVFGSTRGTFSTIPPVIWTIPLILIF